MQVEHSLSIYICQIQLKRESSLCVFSSENIVIFIRYHYGNITNLNSIWLKQSKRTEGWGSESCAWSESLTNGRKLISIKSADTKIAAPSGMHALCSSNMPNNWLHLSFLKRNNSLPSIHNQTQKHNTSRFKATMKN